MLRRKLMINLLVIVLCGAVALTIPVIVNQLQKSADAAINPNDPSVILVSEFVGDSYVDLGDTCVVWQICLKRGNTVVVTWDEIYQAAITRNALSYDREHLKLTRYGLCYTGIHSADDYQKLYDTNYHSYVNYQGRTCLLQLA